jgi:predicted KAP-like P-loop ATPase
MTQSPKFFPDTEPISQSGEDKLGREGFASRICASVARWDLRRGPLVIGIEGSWGEGKSSLMTLIKAKLERQKFLYREFHPWLFGDAESMTVEFFALLAKLIDASDWRDSKKKDALKVLKSYGPSVIDAVGATFPGGPVAAAVARKAAQTGLDRFLKQPSVISQRHRLQELLREAPQPLAICVEDIDRLTPDESLRVATLIRLVGAFPNVVYLLPYDRPHFETLLSIALNDEPGSTKMGEGFRQRLIQLEIPLPKASALEMQRLLDFELNRVVSESGLESDTRVDEAFRRFGELWLFGMRRLFSTPRAITRYAGSLALVLAAVTDEVDLRDLLLVEVLRLQIPTVYQRLRSNLSRYTGGAGLVEALVEAPELRLGKSDAERRTELQSELLKDLDDGVKPVATRILAELLPQVFGGSYGTPERRETKRFSEPGFGERYFRLGLPPDQVSEHALDRAIASAANADVNELVNVLTDLDKQNAVALRMTDISLAGNKEARQRLRDAILAAAPALAAVHSAGLELSWWERLALVFGQLMLNTAYDETYIQRVSTLPPLFLSYAARLSDDERLVGVEATPETEPRRTALRQLGVAKIKEALLDPTIWANPAPLGMYVAVLAAWDPNAVKAAVRQGIDDKPERAVVLLQARVEAANLFSPARVNTSQLGREVDLQWFHDLVARPNKNAEHVKLLAAALTVTSSNAT